jgi:hypothetical protein
MNAAKATAVTATNPRRSIKFPLALIADVSEPVSSTLPDGVLAFSFATDIMPTAALAPTADFARPDTVAANVSVATAEAYSTLGGATAARAEVEAADVPVATAVSTNLATAWAAATYLPPSPTDAPAAMAPAASAAAVSSVVTAVPQKKGGVSGLIAFIFCMNSYIL